MKYTSTTSLYVSVTAQNDVDKHLFPYKIVTYPGTPQECSQEGQLARLAGGGGVPAHGRHEGRASVDLQDKESIGVVDQV